MAHTLPLDDLIHKQVSKLLLTLMSYLWVQCRFHFLIVQKNDKTPRDCKNNYIFSLTERSSMQYSLGYCGSDELAASSLFERPVSLCAAGATMLNEI